MARLEDLYGGIQEAYVIATGNNAIATASLAAPGLGKQYLVTGFSLSIFGTVSTVGILSIRQASGGATRRSWLIPAVSTMPIFYEFKRPIAIPENTDCDINIGTLGAGVISSIEICAIIRVL